MNINSSLWLSVRAKLFLLLAAALVPLAHVSAQAAESKPHFVPIVIDRLGWKDVGFNGCADIKTPNLDALAAGGAKLTQFYVHPICTPTRAATANPAGLIVSCGMKVYGEASGSSKVEGRAKATAKEIAEALRKCCQEQGWLN